MSFQLLSRLQGVASLALIGMGKNVGKTTALNALVQEAEETGVRLGLTSIGRDGELLDAISNHPKPPIRVPAGTLLGTIPRGMEESRGDFEVLARTSMRTALGEVLIARALRTLQWELSGPARGSDLLELRQKFFELGCQRVIFDGAFDRRSSATPFLTDATLLVSGAALDPDMEVVLRETAHRVQLFTLPQAQELSEEARVCLEGHRVALGFQDGSLQYLEMRSALGAHEAVVAAWRPAVDRLLLGSALTPSLLRALERFCPLTIVVRDGTSVLLEAGDLKRFLSREGRIEVLKAIHLPFLVANPYSPYGWRYPAREFLERLAQQVAPLPVIDLVLGESRGLQPV